MDKVKNQLTQDEVKHYFNYKDGVLYWKNKTTKYSHVKIGDPAGYFTHGYSRITINGLTYAAHRLIYIYFNGEIPAEKEIDHIDNNPSNNKIENLRLCSTKQNMFNYKKPKTNTSGIKGVSWHKRDKVWNCVCSINNKSKYIGSYDNINDAKIAIEKFRELHHGEFANNG